MSSNVQANRDWSNASNACPVGDASQGSEVISPQLRSNEEEKKDRPVEGTYARNRLESIEAVENVEVSAPDAPRVEEVLSDDSHEDRLEDVQDPIRRIEEPTMKFLLQNDILQKLELDRQNFQNKSNRMRV